MISSVHKNQHLKGQPSHETSGLIKTARKARNEVKIAGRVINRGASHKAKYFAAKKRYRDITSKKKRSYRMKLCRTLGELRVKDIKAFWRNFTGKVKVEAESKLSNDDWLKHFKNIVGKK